MSDKNKDLLSPDKSPSMLGEAGVKRVNNIPLFIVIGVVTLFSVMIAIVAMQRANAQNQENHPRYKQKKQKKDAMHLAQEVFDKRRIKKPEPLKVESQQDEVPPPVNLPAKPTNAKTEPPVVEDEFVRRGKEELRQEMEHIRQEKVQQFQDAIKAKSSIQINKASLSNVINNNGVSNVKFGNPDDVGDVIKDQVQLLKSMQPKKSVSQSALTLGGNESESRWNLNTSLQSPTSRFELRAGSVIPGVMVSGVSSELPGQVIGQVSQDIYDTATGRYLLIPQGTKLLGVYSNNVGFGKDSVLVAWQRLVFPDGKALDIGSMPGSDSAGMAGFRDQVDHHYVRIYGSALLMSAIVAGVTYSQSQNQGNQVGYRPPTAGDVLSQALGQQLGEVTTQMVSKNLNIAPTVNIRSGYRFNVTVVKDLVFKSQYKQFAY